MDNETCPGPDVMLRVIPRLLGGPPRGCVVVVGARPRGESSVLVRLDGTNVAMGDVRAMMVDAITEELRASHCGSAVVVVYPRDFDDPLVEGAYALRRQLRHRVDVHAMWLVVDERYWSADCLDERCCPPEGRPLPAGARCEPLDSTLFESSKSRSPSLAGVSGDQRRRASRARARSRARLVKLSEQGAAHVWREEQLELFREAVSAALDALMPSDARSGRLIAALEDVLLRDAVIIDLAPGRASVARDALDDSVAGGANAGVSGALRELLKGGGQGPDSARLEAVALLCEHLARFSKAHSAPPLAVAAIAHWLLGDEALAADRASAALEVDPEYRLAALVECTIAAGIAPPPLAA